MVKSNYIFLHISILFIFGICIVLYQNKRINDSYPYFVKEFLDNPTPETEQNTSIINRLNSIENVNLKQDSEIYKNTITTNKTAYDVSTLLTKIKKIEDELEETVKDK